MIVWIFICGNENSTINGSSIALLRIEFSTPYIYIQWIAKLLETLLFFDSFIIWVHLSLALSDLNVARRCFTVVNTLIIQL